METKGFHKAYRAFFILAVMTAMLLCSCAESEEYSGDGGILDSPIGVAVYGQYAYVTNANYDLSGDGKGWVAVIDLKIALSDWKHCIVYRLFSDPYLGDILIKKDRTTLKTKELKVTVKGGLITASKAQRHVEMTNEQMAELFKTRIEAYFPSVVEGAFRGDETAASQLVASLADELDV